MDYVKEIERIQREQERAIRIAQQKTEQAARAALAQAQGEARPVPPRPAAATAGPAAQRTKRPAQPAAAAPAGHAAARAVSSAPPAAIAFAARVARAVLVIPLLAALAFIVEGAMGAWDGYHLHPGELASVIVPLVIAVMLLKLRARLSDPASWARELAAPGRKQAAQNAIGRWVAILIVLVIASAFLDDIFPRGLPVGEWLGWPPPSSGV